MSAPPLPPLDAAAVRELAVSCVTNRGLLLRPDERPFKSAFMLLLAFTGTDRCPPNAGAAYGEYGDAISGMGANGFPIFYAWRLIPTESLDAIYAQITHLVTLLGDAAQPPPPTAP